MIVSIPRAALATPTHLLPASTDVLHARFWQLPEEGRRLAQAARESRGRTSTKSWLGGQLGLAKIENAACKKIWPAGSERACVCERNF